MNASLSLSADKELAASKERQEMELMAQRQTLNEQRTHIDILDSALTNAQTNVIKLEEEVSVLLLTLPPCTARLSGPEERCLRALLHSNRCIVFRCARSKTWWSKRANFGGFCSRSNWPPTAESNRRRTSGKSSKWKSSNSGPTPKW